MKKVIVFGLLVFAIFFAANGMGTVSGCKYASSGTTDKICMKGELSGFWHATIEGQKVYVTCAVNLPTGLWKNVGIFSLKELETITGGNSEFLIARDPGIMMFNGKFLGTEGIGTFTFDEDISYKDYLKHQNIEDIPDTWMLQMFVTGMDRNYFTTLKNLGYTSVSRDQLRDLAFMYVTPGYVESMHEINLKGMTLNKLIMLRAFRIDAAYVEGAREMGFRNITADRIIQLKGNNVRIYNKSNSDRNAFVSLRNF